MAMKYTSGQQIAIVLGVNFKNQESCAEQIKRLADVELINWQDNCKGRESSENGGFHSSIQITVPFDYPAEAPELKLISTNIKQSVIQGYIDRLKDIARRCLQGYSPGYGEDSDSLNKKFFDGTLQQIKQSIKDKQQIVSHQQIRHNLKFLHHQSQLKTKQNQKEARRELRKTVKAELNQELKKIQEYAQQQKQAFENYGKNKTQKKSIFYMVDYFLNHFMHVVPVQQCKICTKSLFMKNQQEIKVQKTFCNHWFHYDCLQDVINKPPFKVICPVKQCKQILGSHEFPIDKISVLNRQKLWALKEARQAQIADAEDLFNF